MDDVYGKGWGRCLRGGVQISIGRKIWTGQGGLELDGKGPPPREPSTVELKVQSTPRLGRKILRKRIMRCSRVFTTMLR